MRTPMLRNVPTDTAASIAERLGTPTRDRTEADLQSDVASLLLFGGLNLQDDDVVRREQPVGDGTRRRLDVTVGHLIIETKKDLQAGPGTLADAEQQLLGYTQTRDQQTGVEHAAVLTDGKTWRLYAAAPDGLELVATYEHTGDRDSGDRLIAWLDTILATRTTVPPTPAEITARLGAESPGHRLLFTRLLDLYQQNRHVPEVRTARALWTRLLRTAFGSNFGDQDELFVRHTLLVLQAEAIAHAVVGYDLRDRTNIDPATMARGTLFRDAGIRGAVEADFFDWVLATPDGAAFAQALIDRIAQFDFTSVEHDVMKVLYESVISADTRHALGEYYTPDWLAEQVVAGAVTDPLNQRVLDPACGSGTFLFHAVRAYVRAAQDAGIAAASIPQRATEHVYGVDVHPVAVTLARVTYLMAFGRDMLTDPDREPFTIPVYVGDSIQWDQSEELFAADGSVVISTSGEDLTDLEPVADYVQGALDLNIDRVVPLRFPEALLTEADLFDRLLDRFTNEIDRARGLGRTPSPEGVLTALGVHEDDKPMLRETFHELVRLADPIWSYYVRNLVRPSWLARPEHRVDVIVGNPPWLRYSDMTQTMQDRYKRLGTERGLLSGARGASGRDLSTLFLVRAVELYLRDGGRFSMVMPHPVMHRRPHEGFRSGRWLGEKGHLNAVFDTSWDLSRVEPLFPMTSCVVHGVKDPDQSGKMPAQVLAYSGRLKATNLAWEQAEPLLTITDGRVEVIDGDREVSPYSAKFRQGAIIVPRRLLRVVEQKSSGPLGAGAGRVAVRSHVSAQEKPPYRDLPPLEGVVERRFLHPMLLGESLAPFRVVAPAQTVLPLGEDRILNEKEISVPEAMSQWWDRVEELWKQNRKPREGQALRERMDYHGQLTAQLERPPHRVAYKKSGSKLDAAYVSDATAIIDHTLYWAPVSSPSEAHYLTGVLNSATVIERTRPLQASGLFGERHIDKYVWYTLVPTFDRGDDKHQRVVAASRAATELAESVEPTAKAVRAVLAGSAEMAELEAAVAEVLPVLEVPEDVPGQSVRASDTSGSTPSE